MRDENIDKQINNEPKTNIEEADDKIQSRSKFTLTSKQQKIISAISIIIFLVATSLTAWYIGVPMIKYMKEPEMFRQWVDGNGILGRIVFVGMVILQVIIAFIPGEPLEIAAGYTFGAIEGTILCLIGLLIGTMIVFVFVRYFGIKAVEVFFPIDKLKKFKFLQDEKKLEGIIFILYLIPGTPKDMLTYFSGLTDIKLIPFLIITTAARIVSVVTSTIGGNALGKEQYLVAIIVFIITIIISVSGIVLYNLVMKKYESKWKSIRRRGRNQDKGEKE